MTKKTDLKLIEQIEHYGRKAGQLYVSEFPGRPFDDSWLTTAYETDSAGEDWPDDSYGQWYEPAAREEIKAQNTE